MRFSAIALNIAAMLVVQASAGAVGDVAEMDNIEKRGCGTGNWCCVAERPSDYCNVYCRAGSVHLDCSKSWVRIHGDIQPFVSVLLITLIPS